MKPLKILITTIGGLTSPDLIQALSNNNEREITIYGVDSFEWAICKNMVDHFMICPNSANDEENFINFIKEICKKFEIDAIIPCGNEDNLALSKHQKNINTPILVGDYTTLLEAYDKGAVYNKLQTLLPCHSPKYYLVKTFNEFQIALEKLSFPNHKVVIKPRFGRGGRGVYIINNSQTFEKFFHEKPENEVGINTIQDILKQQDSFEELIVMEYLQPPFISAYSLCENGKNLLTLKHIREWGNASQTYRGVVSYDKTLESICSKIINIFNLTYTNNMEFAHNQNGDIVLFDLNPRIGASSAIDADIGYNFPYLALKLLLKEKVDINLNTLPNNKRFLRYFSKFWI